MFDVFNVFNVFDVFKIRIGEDVSSGTPPSPLSSEIFQSSDSTISVFWNMPMNHTGDLKDAITVVIDGGAEIFPASVTFSATNSQKMFITMDTSFVADQVVTWQYHQGTTGIILESIYGIEADESIHPVINHLIGTLTVDSTIVTADSTLITADKG